MLKRTLSVLALGSPLLFALPSHSVSLTMTSWPLVQKASRSAAPSLLVRDASPERARESALSISHESVASLAARARSRSQARRGAKPAPTWDASYGSGFDPLRAGPDARDDGEAVADLVLTRDREYDLTPVADDVRPDQGVVPAVPEPAAAVAFGLGGLMVALYRVRRSRALLASIPKQA